MIENGRGETQLLNKLTFRPKMKDRLLKRKRDVVLTRVVDSKALEGSPVLVSRRSSQQTTSNPKRTAPAASSVTTTSINSKDSIKGGNISKEEKASDAKNVAVPSSNATSPKSSENENKSTRGVKGKSFLQVAIDGFNSGKHPPRMYGRRN